MVYALVGPNIHAIRQRIDALYKKFEHDSPITRLDAENADLEDIAQAIGGQSLFASANFVVLANLGKHTGARDQLPRFIASVAEESVLILVETNIDKRTSYYKQLKKLDTFEEYEELNPGMAAEFAKDFVEQRTGTISNTDAMFLVSRLGANQALLASELEKLVLYDPHVTKATIEQLTDQSFQDTIFQLIDALSAGNKTHAHDIYLGLRHAQVHPLEILGTLSWQIHNLVLIKAAGTMPVYDLARATGLAPFVVEKNTALVRRLSLSKLKHLVDRAIEADQALKTTALDADDVLETLLIEIAEATT